MITCLTSTIDLKTNIYNQKLLRAVQCSRSVGHDSISPMLGFVTSIFADQ